MVEQYNSEILYTDRYENKKDLNFKKMEDKIVIVNKIKDDTEEEKNPFQLYQ